MQRAIFRNCLWQKTCPSCYFTYQVNKHSRLLSAAFPIQYSVKASNYVVKHPSPPIYVSSYHSDYFHTRLVYPVIGYRSLHLTQWTKEKESSKVEQTVKALKTEKTKQESSPVLTDEVKLAQIPPKRSLLKRIVDEIIHYYHGFRLLLIDIKVSTRLVWKILNGEDLSRREHRQLVRTVSDLFRILPFSVFIIVPFMEILLPVAIKLFPNMLPSTFETRSEKELKMKKELKVKLEMAKFLQHTLDEMALHRKGDKHSHTAKEFAQFFENIRTTGKQATNEEIMKFSKLFEDEITLDSLDRPQITALCRLLELQPIGTNNFLRFQLRMKLRSLRADDQMIKKEGIETLTVPELQAACRSRGMRALGMPEDRLRSQLQQWLELSLNEEIPPSLLLLSRALYLPENLPATEQLKATISTLPDVAATEAKLKIGETEGKVDNKTKIEVIKIEEEAIKREKEELKQEEKERLEKEALAKVEEKNIQGTIELTDAMKSTQKPPLIDILQDAGPILEDKAVEIEKPELKIIEEKEELSKEDFDNLEDAIEKIAEEKRRLLIEKEELEDLKEEMADYKEDIDEFKEVILKTGLKDLKESKASTRLYSQVNKMITKMDNVLDELSKSRKTLQEQIDSKVKEGISIEEERDNIISINELVLAIRRIQKISDDTRLQRIADVLEKMDEDHDGAVEIENVLKVIELIGKENVKVTSTQMNDILEMLKKEESLETAEKLRKQQERQAENLNDLTQETLDKSFQTKQDQKL
ncbi:mitochondrial proton/calcium exchanger protein-like [Centruroides sculpturatus]|uniref:mitochondrial proton/calcium exchanger protein-like n=1 Tax=Centruroides sculpturatus TaxID=218467 RepID=UPI000C6CEEA6|nr:mitochondrial proton/calcium exchanger protein-like [Centruroides sculpturatus]XP_023218271.1 mitochondrial proton/calcium exchanger protein-like [Centruroides sculpturatus]XP_023218272.1 mitochondrial proton/calcium exchanger protein-like [Centruroides sculpturatus]XP_023218273.1 mitochondrial proton/calcium exchanger protein-like [Centruroides sculpturatus]XP_023218274.1 mitochondrial proton/calcium exchanger protein-like [Centruroides sculpturatus]XP_023218275.1 mitochondrial proton/calc